MNEKQNIIKFVTPPDGYDTDFAIATTMSQDSETVELIAEALSGRTQEQLKTIDRKIRLILIYDKSSPIFECKKIGGVYPIRSKGKRLLHAKMAIIKFTSKKDILFRLIIYTGNFTTTSLNQQIEMIWTHDYKENDEYCKDLETVNKFIDNLLKNFCDTHEAVNAPIEKFLKDLERYSKEGEKSRFIHSLEKPLMEQVIEKFKDLKMTRNATSKLLPNNLIFGTPFLQEKFGENDFVITTFIEKLKKYEICIKGIESITLQTASQNLTKNLFSTCSKNGISVCTISEDEKRCLHSKYIFLLREHGDNIIEIWAYIGSGNLTKNGFENQENIECGIVFCDQNKIGADDFNQLFKFGDELEEESFNETSILDEPKDIKQIITPSVIGAKIENNKLRIFFSDTKVFPITITFENNEGYTIHSCKEVFYDIEMTKSLKITNTIQVHETGIDVYYVLVVDENYTPISIPVVTRNFEEIYSILKTFPNVTMDSEEGTDNPESSFLISKASARAEEYATGRKSFPLYNLSNLIEHIAKENEKIDSTSLNLWCNTLKFTLIDSLDRKHKNEFKLLGQDKIESLKEEFFCPPIDNIKEYIETIDTISRDWWNNNE